MSHSVNYFSYCLGYTSPTPTWPSSWPEKVFKQVEIATGLPMLTASEYVGSISWLACRPALEGFGHGCR